MITAVTRSSLYPDQMITAVTRSSPYPDQMVDHHLETTSTSLSVSGDQDTQMSPRDRSPVRTSSPRQSSGKDQWNQWSPYTLTLLQLEQTTGSSGQRGTAPPPRLSLVSPKVFFSLFCHRWSFGSLPPQSKFTTSEKPYMQYKTDYTMQMSTCFS